MPPYSIVVFMTIVMAIMVPQTTFGFSAPTSNVTSGDITRAKDIALVLPARGNAKLGAEETLFPASWWQSIFQAFHQTSIGDALEVENKLNDWRLVAVRLAPCQPLLPYITPRNEVLCQPELRLIWQPVTQHFIRDKWTAYADDRAIHVLYRFEPEAGLPKERAKVWQDLRGRAEYLTSVEEREFDLLNRELVEQVAGKLRELRGSDQVTVYDELGERPEFAQPQSASAFLSRLSNFLRTFAKPENLTQLTAFSLPEGRDPPMIDEWVFVAFEPSNSGRDLKRQELTVKSPRDGRVLASYGLKARGTVRRDEESLIDLKDQLQGADQDELEEAVIWTFPERKHKASRIADPHRTHVAHTSCISCHKLGPVNFDLHNLSYFENREVSISPRVVQDVLRELEWLSQTRKITQ